MSTPTDPPANIPPNTHFNPCADEKGRIWTSYTTWVPDSVPSNGSVPPAKDPVSDRREAMNNILGSWKLEDAVPTGYGLEVVKNYVAGETDLDEAIELLKKRYPAAGSAESKNTAQPEGSAESKGSAHE